MFFLNNYWYKNKYTNIVIFFNKFLYQKKTLKKKEQECLIQVLVQNELKKLNAPK